MSIWWIVLPMQNYLEDDGCETLFVCKNKVKLADFIIVFLIFYINVAILFLTYSFFADGIPLVFLALFMTSMFLFGLSYCMVFLTKSITITLMTDIIYLLLSVFISSTKNVFPLYIARSDGYTKQTVLSLHLPLAIFGILLTLVGVYFNKKRVCK